MGKRSRSLSHQVSAHDIIVLWSEGLGYVCFLVAE